MFVDLCLYTHMKFAVMKIPEPITVPITKEVAPTVHKFLTLKVP